MVYPVVYILIPVFLVALRKCRVYSWGKCKDLTSLEGKVFLITGANSGIGKETARGLARRKAKVIMACRDIQKAKTAIEEIRRKDLSGELIPMHLDLASLDSVREFSKKVLEEFSKIHVLINNAGVYYPLSEDKKTQDGFEIHLGVNHLGHFLLTNLLRPRLETSSPSRVVIVTSLLFERSVDSFNVAAIPPGYSSSKFANVLFNTELAKRTSGTGVGAYAVCPGFTYTNLFRSRALKWYHYIILAPIAFFYMRTAAQGAQTVLHCAISEEVAGQTGLIYRDCKQYRPKKKIDAEVAYRLWEESEKLVKMSSEKQY